VGNTQISSEEITQSKIKIEPAVGIEPTNLILTKDALYRLSYTGVLELPLCYVGVFSDAGISSIGSASHAASLYSGGILKVSNICIRQSSHISNFTMVPSPILESNPPMILSSIPCQSPMRALKDAPHLLQMISSRTSTVLVSWTFLIFRMLTLGSICTKRLQPQFQNTGGNSLVV
jgi:hypothetical protein